MSVAFHRVFDGHVHARHCVPGRICSRQGKLRFAIRFSTGYVDGCSRPVHHSDPSDAPIHAYICPSRLPRTMVLNYLLCPLLWTPLFPPVRQSDGMTIQLSEAPLSLCNWNPSITQWCMSPSARHIAHFVHRHTARDRWLPCLSSLYIPLPQMILCLSLPTLSVALPVWAIRLQRWTWRLLPS